MRVIILSQLLVILISIKLECDARSTRVSAQYTVAGDGGSTQKTFRERGIVEDASVVQDGTSPKFGTKHQTRRGQKKKFGVSSSPSSSSSSLSLPSGDYDASFQPPEIFAVKGKVYDDVATVSTKSTPSSHSFSSSFERNHPTRGRKAPSLQTKTTPIAFIAPIKLHSQPTAIPSSVSNSFRYPAIQNEEVFQKQLQEPLSVVDGGKKLKAGNVDSIYSYSTIKFSGDDEAKYFTAKKNSKSKQPKRSAAASFNLEQSFGANGQTQYDGSISHVNEETNGGFRPSTAYHQGSSSKPQQYHKKSPGKLFKSTEDEFTESEFFDFSHRPRPGQSQASKFASDLSVKSLAIKPHKNKFDPAPLQHGFKPSGSNLNSFKLKDIPNLHGGDVGHGIASPGQIKTFYSAIDSEQDERYKLKLINDPSPASKAQLQQFIRAKEDERLERLVEEQFKLQQQKQLAKEKEAELKAQQVFLRQQKEKLKHVERQLNQRVNRQSSRQKRRPPVSPALLRRHRNPQSAFLSPSTPINFSVSSNGKNPMPVRTLNGKDGSYRVSFNV